MTSYQSAREEIRRTADIVELIGQFVKLKKAGRNYVGLCPFHAEKDPSFTVSPERQTFHCFGCKKGGDIFSFWMEYHSSTFPEALRDLAERYNVTISEGFSASKERERASQREALFRLNEKAVVYFERALGHSGKGKSARAYLNRRLLRKDTISEFRIGYAPDEWDGLVGILKHEHVDLNLAVQAGLIIPRKSGGHYDRFRNRIIFPIFNLRLQAVGFGGRVLDDSLPKYLNTPETPLFHKGETLYGLHASHKAIREKGRAVIVEGYMDCLSLNNHGLNEVVATLGTALTSRHVRKLKGYADEAVIVFDADEAGKAAALRSLPVFSNEGLSAKAVVLPEGHDPDTFVNENGLDGFLEIVDHAAPMLDFFVEQRFTERDSDEARVRALKEILPVLSEVRDFTLRSLYVRRLAGRIGVKEDAVLSELARFMKKTSGDAFERKINEQMTTGKKAQKSLTDLQLLNLLVHYPETVSRLMACECRILLSDPVVVKIVDTIFAEFSQEVPFSPEKLLDILDSEPACEQFREVLHRPFVCSEQDVEQAVVEFEEEVYQAKISVSFQRAKERGDMERLVQLTKLKTQGPISS
ncbi:MAG: DNA primase [Deltaproteobacteria bacterium]|nr:DNA primase [Deltaproteobacteria bacterium]